jgi:DinB superfamily
MGATPDPVAEAAEYQRFLLAKLGDDDPAEVQAASPSALRAIFRDAGDRLRTPPAPGEWSALETAGHMLDAEVIASARYRWILSEEQPRLVGYDQELWMDRLRHPEEDPEELLATFEALRTANLSLWARATDEDRSRLGIHEERGPESYELTFRLIAGHDRNHLAQARAAATATAGS